MAMGEDLKGAITVLPMELIQQLVPGARSNTYSALQGREVPEDPEKS